MADDIHKSRTNRLAPVLFISLLLTGCTSVTYNCNLPAGPAKPAGYPIPLYTEQMKVPRPCELVGTLSIAAGSFSMSGGSIEKELQTVMQRAREKGADVVKLTAVNKPDYANPNYGLTAALLRYADVWETVSISPQDFQAYLEKNQQGLDPIEGIWISAGPVPHAIGIMKDKSMPGRDFVGFILNSANPVWPVGAKKMDIRRGVRPGNYVVRYYLDDFEPYGMSLILGQKRVIIFNIQKADGEEMVFAYSKK